MLDELGMEHVPDIHHHAEQVPAPPGEQPGVPVGSVPKPRGNLQHSTARRRTGTRRIAEHERYRSRGQSDLSGDVLQPRTSTCTGTVVVGRGTWLLHQSPGLT